MKNKTHGQAAMEFLMTYGWAILVVVVALGALAYFGVLDPGKLLPGDHNECLSEGEWIIHENSCADFCESGSECINEPTPACNCGEGYCWDNSSKKCVADS